jgi:TPR repeat protein
MEQLASKGLAVAQLRHGLAHLAGYGYTADATKAIDYLTQATKSTGSFKSDAAFVLGQLYRDGQLKPEVMPWLLRAASAGLVTAEYQIGTRYQQGRGVQQDFVAAGAWFNRAARSGHAQAQLHLGEMYEKGMGVKRDHGAARQLFELSAKGGNLVGVVKYAEVLAKGIGGKQDIVEAYVYAESAASAAAANATASNTPVGKLAIQLRDSIIKIMTAEQLTAGEKRLTAAKKAAAKKTDPKQVDPAS